MASTRLTKTFSSSGNRNKWTISMWIKRSKLGGSTQALFTCYQNGSYKTRLHIESDDELYFNDEYNGNTNGRIVSNAKLRDTNGWYHIVGIWDKDNSTSGDRIRFYINGERVTSFSDTGNAPSNASTLNTDSLTHEIGAQNDGNKFDGLMSHIHFCDGYAYDASYFGETDSTTGEWKIKTSPSVSYGTNGFFILKDGNSVTDQSPNTNNWTVGGGTLTKTEDNPSNVFCTLNELTYAGSQFTLRYGNNSTYGVTSNAWRYLTGTLAANSGKFYWEVKYDTYYAGDQDNIIAGIVDIAQTNTGTGGDAANGKYFGLSRGYGLDFRDGKIINGTTSRGNGTTYSADLAPGDILGVAMDLDNNKLYFAKNGTWQYSSNPENGTNPAFTFASGYTYAPVFSSYYNTEELTFNFGNGYFGTTQISSAGTNASNNGIFEYDVPAGYTALSTKGLNL